MRNLRSRIHLCRHGEVDSSWATRIYGGKDVPLAPEGVERFRRLAKELRGRVFSLLVASDLQRARVGAELIGAELGMEPRLEPRLREIDRGRWAGMEREALEPGAFEAYLADPYGYRGHGGESHADLEARIVPVLEELAEEFPGGEVFVVCHGQVQRVAAAWVLKLRNRDSMRFTHSHGGITTLDRYADGHWQVQALNAPSLREGDWGGRVSKP
ncbi:MAG TPA: histidine phosphatase family protein [Planctomycetes bacterium]|nr:histidine phosphatase family protein [Planctomycetota bacterium]